MITKLLILLLIVSIITPYANATPLSDKTGLKFTFPITTDGHSFIVEATGNLNIKNLDFEKDKKSFTMYISSSIENNSLEISFPNQLLGGDYGVFLNNNPISAQIHEGNNMTFVMIDFTGTGNHKIEISGTTYLDFLILKDIIDYKISDGYVDDIEGNQSTNSLIFTLFDPGDDGILTIKLSDDVITPFDDGSFIVLIDDVESDYIIENDNIIINFDSNSQQITLIGTYVVPEFYEIAPLVLATSFIGLIILKKYKKLFV